ncbi:MAG: tyrosine-type recombinase/integrase [bacterium]|nr:tyrosine-type recombinase/integrase [bacterium]
MPASANALTKALTRHAAQACIEFHGKILHGFRASLATSLANENPAVAQRILRHANISTTISHYVNLPEATSRNLLDRVSESSSTDSQLPVN